MKKVLLIGLLSLTGVSVADVVAESVVIKDASYVVCDGDTYSLHGLPFTRQCQGKFVTYFTYDGQPLKKVSLDASCSCKKVVKQFELDPSAPKPQPAYYRIEGLYRATGLERMLLGKYARSDQGLFILFYDKNNNKIANYCLQARNKDIRDCVCAGQRIYQLRGRMPHYPALDLSKCIK